LVRASGS